MDKFKSLNINIHKGANFEARYFLVLCRQVFRSPSLIITFIFSTLLYVSFPLIMIVAADIEIQPSRQFVFESIVYMEKGSPDIKDPHLFLHSQEQLTIAYKSIYYQIQVWSSFIRPIAILVPVSIIINKILTHPLKSGALLVYVGTPINKAILLLISFSFTIVFSLFFVLMLESISTIASVEFFSSTVKNIAPKTDAEVRNLFLGLSLVNENDHDLLASAPALYREFSENINNLLPNTINEVSNLAWSSFPYSIGMTLLFLFMCMPITFLIGLKSNSRFASQYLVFIVSISSILFWGLNIPLARLNIDKSILLIMFQVLSYTLIGIYPSFITASSLRLGGFNKFTSFLRFTLTPLKEFDIVQKKLSWDDAYNNFVTGKFSSSDLYMPVENMIGTMLGILLVFIPLTVFFWKKQDVQ